MSLSFRIPAALLTIVFVVLAIAGAAAEVGPAGAPALQGDANCDGAVGAGDALAVLSDEAGLIAGASDCVNTRGDTDCNGASDNADVIAILRYVIEGPVLSAADDCIAIGSQLATPTVLADTSSAERNAHSHAGAHLVANPDGDPQVRVRHACGGRGSPRSRVIRDSSRAQLHDGALARRCSRRQADERGAGARRP